MNTQNLYLLLPANANTVKRGDIYLLDDNEGDLESVKVKVFRVDQDGFYYNHNNQAQFVNFNIMDGILILRTIPEGYPLVLVRESAILEVNHERLLKFLDRNGFLKREDSRNKLLKTLDYLN